MSISYSTIAFEVTLQGTTDPLPAGACVSMIFLFPSSLEGRYFFRVAYISHFTSFHSFDEACPALQLSHSLLGIA